MKVYLITKAKKVIVEEVPASQRFWIRNEDAYHLENSSIKLTYKISSQKINPSAEIFFVEGSPVPLGSTVDNPGMTVLDTTIYKTHLESIAHVSYSESMFDRLRKLRDALTDPKSIALIGFVVAGIYIAYLWLHGAIRF